MKVAVIGGAGRMGRWLVGYFLRQGHKVVLSDIRHEEAKTVARSTGVKLARSNLEAVEDADLSLFSTPIEVTAHVLEKLAPQFRRLSTVMEISSLKSSIVPVLRKISEREVRTLSVHPLFGPGVQKLAGEKIALIPVSDPALELKLTRNLFPDAEMVVVDVEEHDRAMALTLSLPHFLNIAFASVIGDEDVIVLKKLGGTTFKLQLVLSESVMSEDPNLYASIQMSNPYTDEYLRKLVSKAETLRVQVAGKDVKEFSQFYKDVQSALSKDSDFAGAYRKMYQVLETL